MKILHVSNIVSPHQLPLARELRKIVGDGNYIYAAMQLPDKDRQRLGWDCTSSEPWIITPGSNLQDQEAFETYWKDFDVVICGERLFDKMTERVKNGKLCFYMSERWWKPPIGKLRLLHPSFFKMTRKFRKLSESPCFHYLPTGVHAARDIKFISELKDRIWNWGYFTQESYLQPERNKSDKLHVLWAGRMLKWKLVGDIIKAASVLGDKINLTLIGEGPDRLSLEELANNKLIKGAYLFNNFMPVEKIPSIMAVNDVYVLPSSEYEGWGAVVNEAMSVGCVPVVSRGAGAASMIHDGVDGLLFDVGDWKRLSELLILLADNHEYRLELSRNAKQKIEKVWAPAVVAKRFVSVVESLINDVQPPDFSEGPMSRN